MDKENKIDSRASFLKKVTMAFVAVAGIGITGFSFQKHKQKKNLGVDFKPLSDEEAKEIIRNMPSVRSHGIKPEPPPNKHHTSKD